MVLQSENGLLFICLFIIIIFYVAKTIDPRNNSVIITGIKHICAVLCAVFVNIDHGRLVTPPAPPICFYDSLPCGV